MLYDAENGEMTMLEVKMADAKQNLEALVDRVTHGEEVVITEKGQAVVRLVATTPAFDVAAAEKQQAHFGQKANGKSGRIEN